MMQTQGLQQQESCVRASWESFAYVDEEAEDNGDKVSLTTFMLADIYPK